MHSSIYVLDNRCNFFKYFSFNVSSVLTSLRECWRQIAEEGALQHFPAATEGGCVRNVAERIIHRVLLLVIGPKNESFWQPYSLSLEILSMPHLTQKTVALKPFHSHEYPDSLWSSLGSLPGTWKFPRELVSSLWSLSLPMTQKILIEPPLALQSSPLPQSVPTPLYTSTISYWMPTPCLHLAGCLLLIQWPQISSSLSLLSSELD